MLIAIVMELESTGTATLPAELGRANYAAVLEQLGRLDPALAEDIHAGNGPKPVTCSGLLGCPGGGNVSLRPGQTCRVRVTGLNQAVCQGLVSAFLDRPPETWNLHGHGFRVTGAGCDPETHEWAGRTGYRELAARLVQPGRRPNRVRLELATATGFKQTAGPHMPLPLPELVFGSLADRWNAFSPVAFSPELRRFCAEQVALSSFRLESRSVAYRNGGMRIGAAGRASYTILGQDPYWRAVLDVLADFAFYCGVGGQTTTGMGQVRRV